MPDNHHSALLPGDDPAEFQTLFDDLTAHFAPRDFTETRLVREMAISEWRLRRARQYLESALSRRMAELAPDHPTLDAVELQSLAVESLQTSGRASYGTWLAYESKFERQYDRACNNWYRYQMMQRSESAREVRTLVTQAFAPLPQLPPEPELGSNVQMASNVKLASNVQNAAPPQTPRGAPCPCGSGRKYKRCCGPDAAPILSPPPYEPPLAA